MHSEIADQLKERLEREGRLKPGQFQAAEVYALERGHSVEKALVSLKYVDCSVLGQHLSELYALPYISLLPNPPERQARRMLSFVCARTWKVLPIAYDQETDRLTIAVHSRAQIDRLERIHRLFMLPHTLGFSIAPEAEIEAAFERFFESDSPEAEKWENRPSALSRRTEPAIVPAADPAPPAADAPAAEAAAEPAPPPASAAPPAHGLAAPYRFEDVGRALVNAVALLCQERLRVDDAALQRARARVRYSQLLATRLQLPPHEVDALIMSAWLSSDREDPLPTLERLLIPHPVREILTAAGSGADASPAARIFSLVLAYETYCTEDPAHSGDVALVRRQLSRSWGSSDAHDAMLETFLQVLMDEDFLAKAERSAGAILVVDPAEPTRGILGPPLMADGFDVTVLPSAAAAEAWLAGHTADLIIADVALPSVDGITFCRAVKRNPATAKVPVLMLADDQDEKTATRCLRAGADEFLTRPVNLELLFLKLQRLLDAGAPGTAHEAGVTGSLKDMSFTDLIQILCAGGKTTEIELSREGNQARVYLQEGNIVHAQSGSMEGENAFYDLMRWTEGDFRTRPCVELPPRTIHAPTMSLLMEGARLNDEGVQL